MNRLGRAIPILMADDDPDDCMLARMAFDECRLANPLVVVPDGQELMNYLHRRGEYADPVKFPRPGLILLDLKMPRKNGLEALREIRSDDRFRSIPVVVLTTSHSSEDVVRSYELGVNSFITKPVTFGGLVEMVKTLHEYWFGVVELPSYDQEART